MKNKLHLFNRKYAKFSDFVSEASSWELEHIIMHAEFTKAFSAGVKDIIRELDPARRELAALSIVFNTEDEIAIIDETLVGGFIGDRYKAKMEEYYKAPINKIVKQIAGGSTKSKYDFLNVSFDTVYKCLNILYKYIRCRKDVIEGFKVRFNLPKYNDENLCIVVGALMIVEDIARYINVEDILIVNVVNDKFSKKFSHYI